MKYITKEWCKNQAKSSFQMELEIIRTDERDIEKIFLNEYNKMRKQLAGDYEEYVFDSIFDSFIKNTKRFFSKETLKKVRDIRLLALGKVFEDEYDFVEREVIKKDLMRAYDKEYKKIENKLPKDIKEKLCLHDCTITDVIKQKDKLIIELDCSQGIGEIQRIIFNDYTILEEEKDFINGWWLYEEIYIDDEQYELHMLIDKKGLGCFTVRARKIELE